MIKVQDLSKTYKSFKLDKVNFDVKPGSIMGFIGRNGAGKTTTLKAIMNLIMSEGKIKIFDKFMKDDELNIKQNIGFSLCDINCYMDKTVDALTKVTSRFYNNWDHNKFDNLCKLFNIDKTKRINQLSSGMKVKYQLAVALSHDAKILILDEPTSGLDPISRDEIIHIFEEYIKKDNRAILFSTHITSDLDKCADSIAYIHDGKIRFAGTKNDFVNNYIYVSGNQLQDIYKDKTIGYVKHNDGFECLIYSEYKDLFHEYKQTKPTLEQIMVCLERGSKNEEFNI